MNPEADGFDREYLRQVQYRTADNLNARIQIHKRFSTSSQNWEDFIFGYLPDLRGKRLWRLVVGTPPNGGQTESSSRRMPGSF